MAALAFCGVSTSSHDALARLRVARDLGARLRAQLAVKVGQVPEVFDEDVMRAPAERRLRQAWAAHLGAQVVQIGPRAQLDVVGGQLIVDAETAAGPRLGVPEPWDYMAAWVARWWRGRALSPRDSQIACRFDDGATGTLARVIDARGVWAGLEAHGPGLGQIRPMGLAWSDRSLARVLESAGVILS